jgi:hypothetical protein
MNRRTSTEEETLVAWYRMYFVDRLHRTRVPQDLQAQEDKDALCLAYALQYACFDEHISIEIWQGARRVLGTAHRTPAELRAYWEEVNSKRQQVLSETQEALRNRKIIHPGTKSLLERAVLARQALDQQHA